MTMTKLEAADRAAKIWSNPTLVAMTSDGGWLIDAEKIDGPIGVVIGHALDGNGHPTCHDECKAREDALGQPAPVAPPPSEADQYFAMELDDLGRRVASARRTIAELRDDLAKDPCRALEWSRDAFEAATKIRVFGGWLEILTAKGRAVLGTAIAELRRDVVRGANRGASQSTSPTSNLVEACDLKAKADLLERLEGVERHLEFIAFRAGLDLRWYEHAMFRETTVLRIGDIGYRVARKSKGSKYWVAVRVNPATSDGSGEQVAERDSIEAARNAAEADAVTRLWEAKRAAA